ncbi:glycerophosphodiester phosphodiesterase [Pontibacter sp. G13]|uniref:glycerophosphodiester phosphodiesterase n=1 Tax=Pontibacter sp. G13 TaxID=3074898 RepID=UPI00288C0B3E|nr:glycerophosphodiester phosphodiesterase [Pontibacter sp. G13]WNJ15971.1 glycerophosphodiester phosphodiesterase [Pontibacter sp. G13]
MPPQEKPFDFQGHRGCRGLLPENSIPAFKKAIDLGVTTLELDVVISKDSLVVVSHEPFLSHEICLDLDGNPISEELEQSYNMFQMTYQEIQSYDCGSKPHPRFPEQASMDVRKPLLSEVIQQMEAYSASQGKAPLSYNIETKSQPGRDHVFHPSPEVFTQLVVEVIQEGGIAERTILQSFDVRTLQAAHQHYPDLPLALLVEEAGPFQSHLDRLGFTPSIYSPEYSLLNQAAVQQLHEAGIRVIPWTVNDPKAAKQLEEMGVDGFITDYPDRVRPTVK